MASDFLKRKAREQAEQGIHTGTTVKEKEDGTMPSSDQDNQYVSSRASGFLSKKAEEQAASVTERFGEDAYGGTKWRSENSALSSNTLSQLLQQVQGLGTPGATSGTKRTSGGYYSRPVAPEGIEDIYSSVSYLTPALREAAIPVTVAQEGLQATEADLQIVSDYLQRAMEAYNKNPSAANANTYNQIVAKYDEIYREYTAAYDAYNAAYNKYKSTEDQAAQILNAYQSYSTAQQAAYDDWRGTIRDSASIEASIVDIAAQLKASEQQDQQAVAQTYAQQQTNKPWWQNALEAAYNGAYGIDPSYQQSAQLQQALESAGDSDRTAALRTELELLKDELGWSKYFFYDKYRGDENFDSLSRYVPQERQERRAIDIMLDNYSNDASGWEDPLYEAVNGNQEAASYISNTGAGYYGSDNALGAIYGRAAESKSEADQMTEYEVAMFNYLYATQGPAAAHDYYYNYLQTSLFSRERAESEAYWQRQARENPVGSSIFSVAVSPMKGLTYLGQAADLASDGEIDANAAYNKFSYVPSSIRSEVAQTIEDSGKWGSVGSFAYQTGLSMADFLFATGISGGNSALAMTIMGSGAAADTTLAATERGVEGWKAFTLGTLAGAAEAFTERFSIETLLNPKMLKDGTLKYILKNMIAEGAEEGASDLINLFCDILIAGGQSEWQQSINAYMADGMTEQAAFLAAFKDQALTVGLDILGGAMSGGILSSGNAMIQNNSNRWIAKKYDLKNVTENEAQEIIDSGLESGQDTESYQLAQQLQEKLDSGKIPTADELSRLLWATEQAIQAEENQGGYDGIDDNDPDWIALPTVEDDSGVGNSVIDQQQNVTDGDENVIALQNNVPLSIAEQIRQNQNGGIRYENTQSTARPATSRPAAETNIRRGAGLSDGIEGRNAGTGTAEQTGILASSPEQRRSAYADRSRATVARQNYARSLRLEKVSSLDLGLQNGTEARNIQVMPQENWDAEMSQLADRIYNETGKGVTYVMGRIQIRGTGGVVGYARGVITGDRIVVQADHLRIPMEQIADHEAYHAKVDFTDGRLNDEIRRHIVETFSEEQFRQVLDKYIVSLRGVIDVNEARNAVEFEEVVRQIEEEIFADAYAGINAFGAGADQFTGAVNEKMDQLYMGKIRSQDNGTEEPTGPPAERYSADDIQSEDVEILRNIGRKSINEFTTEDIQRSEKWARKFYNELGVKSPFFRAWFGDWRAGDTSPVSVLQLDGKKTSPAGKATNKDTGKAISWGRDYFREASSHQRSGGIASEIVGNAVEIVENAVYFDTVVSMPTSKSKMPNTAFMHHMYVLAEYEGHTYLEKLYVEEALNNKGTEVFTRAYTLKDIKKVAQIPNSVLSSNGGLTGGTSATDISVADLFNLVKEYDAEFKPKSASKAVNENGTPKIMYHGSAEQFTVFSYGQIGSATGVGVLGDGFYFTDKKRLAQNYGNNVYPIYLQMKNPYMATESDVYKLRTTDLQSQGYDGVILRAPKGDVYMVFENTQIKSATDNIGTFDGGNPDIRYSVDDADDQVAIGDLQAELYQLKHQRRSLLEADTAYAAAADNLRYANTFTEKVAARKAMAAAAANIDTAAIDQRISDLNEQISEIRNRETRRHREDQEKYSGTKTAGYSTMPDTRLKDLDQDYMKAVRSGDRTRMAELVEQAAEAGMPASVVRDKSGRLLNTYHHTGNRFTVFDRNMARTGTEMDGFFFAPDPDSTSEYGSNMITAYLNITKLAMDPKLDRKFNDSGTLLREKLAYQGYDGMARTENGEIYEYMTFDPEQIKSADPVVYDDRGRVVPLSERFNFRNPDIRYSVDDGGQDPAQQKPAAPKKKIRPVAESRPLIAKKDLRNTVLNLFSIPNGQRAEVGAMIDSYADRLIKNGSLTEDDRKAFFDRMYDAGVMVMPAEEYSAFARSHIVDGRIYVSDSVKSDFGDDWADIRRRAFAAGVYLVNDRSASGIEQWNATLSAEDMLPGLFDSEETDERTILERILQVAEEGKDEHLSLAEYTRRLSQQEGISEDEFLDNMERQLDWALRTFAEKARLEVHLRDRTGRKIAQEREKGAERMTRQQAKEAQRRADERQARKDSARRAKERRELRELQQRTLKQLQWLSKNRNRAPEELQATWDEVLGDIDLYAISAADEMRWSDKHNATWKDLAQMYKDAMKNDPNFLPSKELERIVTRLDATKIADMDLGALQDLYKAAIGLRTEFYNRNNVINDEMQRLFAEVYTDAKREIESAPGGFTGGVADKFLNLDQLTPMNVLQRMAGWDPDGAFYSMAKQLERGERDMRAYSVKAQKMLQDFLTEHEDWVKKADGQGKDAIWYEVEVPQLLELGMGDKPIFGPTVKVYMTPAQKVHMFLESKNLDNLRHMTGGRTFVNKDLYSQGKRQEALSQGRTIKLAPETVRKLVSDLTPEEMELAQILDRYYNTFATQEINKVSNILYGYDKAMGKNYAPIYTNRNYTKTEFGVFDTTAEGVGNLKGRQYAVNPSYNISAFDAFERHVDQTARFCGMAIPARNWTTLMNWREKNNSTGDVITHKWGEESKRYITDLITTLQAGDDAKSDTISSGLSKLQSNYITAIFGANPSIVLKQLGSIPLAGAYLDARNMPTPAQISKIDRSLISKYTQELEWRTMGYATPETKQLKDNPNWTQTNKVFKFVFGGGAITAMDGWAASTLWPWAENKVRREHPELAVGTKAQIDAGESAFYKKVAEEFEIAVSRSQSVSDEIHQGTLRKSKNPITKAFTMFRSDSAQTYNALRQKIGEARYYMRTGAKEKVVQTAKKAAGTAFVAMLLNAAWSEAISFLMALWKNKGKYYRDDEDELTLQSVAGEMVSNMLGSYAGVITGGEELFELIGNIITGDTWYGIETPGMEQLNDLLDTLIESGSGMRDLVAGGWDVLKNGGNLGDYFSKHSGEMLGGIKDLAKAAAMYLSGMPASNLEAYLTGAMKWISPELGAAYDDLFAETGKSDLAGMEGDALEGRVGRILSDRNVSESDDTAAALAALYEAGYKTAIPSDTPTSVSIDGEKHSLGEYQQQAYDTIWGGIVADALDDMVASDSFKEADPKTQAKMLSNLYTFAAEQAKAELFDEYELDSGAAKNAAIVAAGATVAECITWNTITSEMKSGEKSAELASWDIPEEAKQEIFRCKISDSREDSIAAFDEAGLSFDQFLQAYSMYSQINNEDLKAGMKAVEFSHWVNAQGYTAEQAAVVKDELTYFNMTPASSSRYDELVGAGMDPDEAYDLTGALNELQPEDGADEVSDLQKWRASVDFSDDVEDQLAALSAVMTDAQFQKVEIANNFGVSPDAYVTLQEIKSQYDVDSNGSYTNAEIKAAIEGMDGYYSIEHKAVLWQLVTGSTSARNNPYSKQVGQKVLDARAAAKTAAKEDELEGLTLGNW